MKKKNIEDDMPPYIIKDINKPNFELMAKAFMNLYYETKKSAKKESAS